MAWQSDRNQVPQTFPGDEHIGGHDDLYDDVRQLGSLVGEAG